MMNWEKRFAEGWPGKVILRKRVTNADGLQKRIQKEATLFLVVGLLACFFK
jgi:hypothetical protein